MPILFCERCGRETEWAYLGGNAIYCKGCGWQMSESEFRIYRSRVLLEEFRKFVEEERKKDPLEALYNELEHLIGESRDASYIDVDCDAEVL